MKDKPFKFYNDDGKEINPDLIKKPTLCVTCKKDDDPSEEILCTLNRIDQKGEMSFHCEAYEPKRYKKFLSKNLNDKDSNKSMLPDFT